MWVLSSPQLHSRRTIKLDGHGCAWQFICTSGLDILEHLTHCLFSMQHKLGRCALLALPQPPMTT